MQPKSKSRNLRLIHYNDVYNVFSKTHSAARFVSAISSYRKGGKNYDETFGDPFVVFSGDALSPSPISPVTLGMHMVPVLQNSQTRCFLAANHDFDMGVDAFEKFKEKMASSSSSCSSSSSSATSASSSSSSSSLSCEFIISNVREVETQLPLGHCKEYAVVEHEGLKIGMIGVAEQEWIACLYTLTEADIIFEPAEDCVKRLSEKLKKEEKVDVILLLTHMREPRDEKLARDVSEFAPQNLPKILFGAHDHFYASTVVSCSSGNFTVLKSHADFKSFSVVDIVLEEEEEEETKEKQQRSSYSVKNELTAIKRVDINPEEFPEEDEATKTALLPYQLSVVQSSKKVIGYTKVDLDCITKSVRTAESAIGNFICDSMMRACPASVGVDVAILNSGTIRTDAIIPAGPISEGDLMILLPLFDPLVLVSVSGKTLLEAFENGVSQVPAHEGRFISCAGCNFDFDPSATPGERVIQESVKIGGKPLDLQKKYRVVTKEFIAPERGGDGYTMFVGAEELVDRENMVTLTTAVRYSFLCLEVVAAFKEAVSPLTKSRAVKQAALKLKMKATFASSSSSSDNDDNDSDSEKEEKEEEEEVKKKKMEIAKLKRMALRLLPDGAAIAPKVEGRVRPINKM